MAVNKPVGDNARKGAVRKRSQLKTKIVGEGHWTKRSKESGHFMDQKKSPKANPYKGVRREKECYVRGGQSPAHSLSSSMLLHSGVDIRHSPCTYPKQDRNYDT